MNRFIKIIILSAVMAGTGCNRDPKDIFAAVFDNVPKSVRLLHGKDQLLFDCCLWLHFKIDSTDLKKLIDDKYVLKNTDFDSWKGVLPPGTDWWKPEQLGASALYYTKDSEKTIEAIFTNPKMTEVYYVNYLR
jgi:hypothetical protein